MIDYVKLTKEEKRALLDIAKKTIEYRLINRNISDLITKEKRLYELKLGCFVTLKKKGDLRGCIGTFVSRDNLVENVKKMAVAAAFDDPRFYDVTLDELKDLSVEISVLYPLIKINSIEEIKVGRDGLYVIYGYYSGVLLPQVALEYGWSREEFLSHTCIKAGLPQDAWKNLDIEIYRFEAEVFGEVD